MNDRKDLVIINVALDETDDELISYLRHMRGLREKGGCAIVCLLECPKGDKREVYEIPACRDLCRRLVACGFISYLEPTTQTSLCADPDLDLSLGAFEVWLTSHNLMRKRIEVSEKTWNLFVEELGKSNARADQTVGPMNAQGA